MSHRPERVEPAPEIAIPLGARLSASYGLSVVWDSFGGRESADLNRYLRHKSVTTGASRTYVAGTLGLVSIAYTVLTPLALGCLWLVSQAVRNSHNGRALDCIATTPVIFSMLSIFGALLNRLLLGDSDDGVVWRPWRWDAVVLIVAVVFSFGAYLIHPGS